ncbi:DMT family transporter [Sporomusa acidovorans]|uniref:Multidrug resistance protein EbrA n=1 Tax=Sporomusa acidovorans (strain ATCC 49682 / DSM 3132 / Mol) TaxID=1123286 RepID=A0ABZ3IXU7_SPOA4|nr:multidrug efflux SMR transporter [Sporomusa acidovorans]OZC23305.1 multidrug resistance protein EbrA [Sporomusa acidovorans DSM 3132]SDE41310.1 small multidrug resistance pump [Sporomusa acidovorans]
MNGYVLLGIAITLELFATSMLKASAGFTKLIPSMAFIGGMSSSFYLMSQALTSIPLSIAYAIWSGVGTALTALIGVLIWKEHLTVFSGIGILLIIMGVIFLNLKGPAH